MPTQLAAAEIQPLPSPPLLQHLLFEIPYPLCIALFIAAAVAWTLLGRRGDRRAPLAAAACFALAAGIWALAAAVKTEREKLQDQTIAFVAAVSRADAPAVDAMLAESAHLYYPFAPRGIDKPRILDMVRSEMAHQYQVKAHSVLETHASLDAPDQARVLVRVYVQPAEVNFPVYSWWRLDWRKDSSGRWRATSIQSLWINLLDERPGS
jgi:hypothetical protein